MLGTRDQRVWLQGQIPMFPQNLTVLKNRMKDARLAFPSGLWRSRHAMDTQDAPKTLHSPRLKYSDRQGNRPCLKYRSYQNAINARLKIFASVWSPEKRSMPYGMRHAVLQVRASGYVIHCALGVFEDQCTIQHRCVTGFIAHAFMGLNHNG